MDIAVAFLSYRGWFELKPSLMGAALRGGRLRLVRRDVRQNSAEAVEELFRLPNAQIAFGLEDTAFHSKDYLFHEGKRLTVLTSSPSTTYAGLMHNDEGGAIIKHAEISTDEVAQKAIAIFERRWRNATLVDEKVLAAFKAEAVSHTFAEGDFVRSTNDLEYQHAIRPPRRAMEDLQQAFRQRRADTGCSGSDLGHELYYRSGLD